MMRNPTNLLRHSAALAVRLAHQIFIVHSRIVDVVAWVIIFGVAGGLMVKLLYVPPPQVEIPAQTEETLHVAAVDEIVAWIEVRSRAREVGLVLPPQTLLP